jgi:rhodanese-related sulfurtransferase
MSDTIEHFAARLRYETDVSDVHARLEAGDNFVLVDSRGIESWAQGRVPRARHLPTREIADRALAEIPLDTPIVTYCWGPGCNGATRAALEFAKLGYHVQEMIGGYEYWVREGFAFETHTGIQPGKVDPLTAPLAVACAC